MIEPIKPVAHLPQTPLRSVTAARSQAPAKVGWHLEIEPLDTAPASIRSNWSEAQRLLGSEDFEAALDVIDATLSSAERLGCGEALSARLYCSRIAVAFAAGHDTSDAKLRELLMSATSLATTHFAAYQLGRQLELQQHWKRALFYARIALQAADEAGRDSWVGPAHNLNGNLLTAESRFEEAIQHYREAIRWTPKGSLWSGQIADNMSFACASLGNLEEARSWMARALLTLRGVTGPARLSVELDAAFLYLLCDRSDRALDYACRARQRALELDDQRNYANALLVLAEAAKRVGHRLLARRSVSELAECYDREFANVLWTHDVLQLVNLKA